MVDGEYVSSLLDGADTVELSRHAKRRAELRGIEPERVRSVLEEGDVLGARSNDNPNIGIDYTETYLLLIESESSELFYLPVYFSGDRALVATVLKFSESNEDLLEW